MKKFIYPLVAVALSSIAISSITIAQQRKPRFQSYVEFLNSEDTTSLNVPFSEAVRVGNILYLSGNIGNIPGEKKLVEGGIKAETKQAMENIKRVLERNGSSFNKVFKCTVMLADIKEWAAMNQVYSTYFPNNRFPARSAFGTSGLALGARTEITCMATVR
ncbi:putative translation initiation inhibitor, yjgF family [Rivularia sp. PCC 7116]|uniref:RidA family protein n=1 Tax=Rivularia sp. PCC 7116 TaxID=373994 RepID=UPI00029F2344|nr:RidA family protein [Rivularia sp. PCC 7116]AFY56903.1 putative translation initiation inhibitor, yjgF family [Rivularia sp. PCC 7116]